MFTKDQAMSASLSFFGGDELAANVFLDKYAMGTSEGFLEKTPDDMWRRMAMAGASIEKDKQYWEKAFYGIFQSFKAVPQGSIMFSLGNKFSKSSCSNCFVLEIQEDSIDGIFNTARDMANTYKYRGGCGVDLGGLRPKNASVSNAAKTSTGAASFMEFYSQITNIIGMHGRRGALMLTMPVSHPDIEEFIKAKHDKSKVTGANISVKITDDFMKRVESNGEWVACFRTPHETITKKWKARDLWKMIIDSATNTAEPGILFWDSMIKNSPADIYSAEGYNSVSVNPCSELILENNGACTLLSMNLSRYTKNNFNKEASFDEDSFFKDVFVATRFLDNVKTIDADLMPLPGQRKHAVESRRIGMGIHGLADAMANLNIKYDSTDGVNFIDKLFEKYTKSVYGASVELAKEKGVFPIFNSKKEIGHPFLERIGFAGKPRRNIACMTLAPTGSVSILSQTSSGMEPVFRNSYTRRVRYIDGKKLGPEQKIVTDSVGGQWIEYSVYHHNVTNFLKENPGVKLPEYFVTSDKIDWRKRVEVQAKITNWLDHSVSSTINLPKGTTSDVVSDIYFEAWRSGCKGITVYVDGCRDGVLISGEADVEKNEKKHDFAAIRRPKKVPCDLFEINSDSGKWIVVVGLHDDKPYEIFAGKPTKINIGEYESGYIEKQGNNEEGRGIYTLHVGGQSIVNLPSVLTDAQKSLTRQISLSLRHNIPIKYVVQQLEKSDGSMASFEKAIARVLKKYIKDGEVENGAICSSCKQKTLVRQEGCITCSSCGWTKCS